jgi:hypothetical protein
MVIGPTSSKSGDFSPCSANAAREAPYGFVTEPADCDVCQEIFTLHSLWPCISLNPSRCPPA